MLGGTTVHAICNHSTGDAYIGEAYIVRNRWVGHRSRLRKGKHHNRALQAAWDCYGAAAFGLAILERVPCREVYGSTVTWCEAQERQWLIRARAAGIVLYNDQVGRGRRKAA